MAIDPQLLEQALTAPVDRDVRDSPIVTAVILPDVANAAALVPYLDKVGTNASANARRILCLFEAGAARHVAEALRSTGVNARKEGIDILWSILVGESARTLREILNQIAPHMEELLDDKRPLPGEVPEYIERGFRGRICDLVFVVLHELLSAEYEPSSFQSLDEKARDEEIARLKRSFGTTMA